jgi:hypothetical protein
LRLPFAYGREPHALPQQFEIGKADLPRRRPRHGSTQQVEKCRPQVNRSAPHPADDIGRPFGAAANHRSNESHRTPTGKQNPIEKMPKIPIPPHDVAFRDRN